MGGVGGSYPVTVGGEGLEGVHNEEVSAGKGVDEAAPIALTQGVKDTGLVQVHEVD